VSLPRLLQVRTAEDVAWSPAYEGQYCPLLWDASLATKLRLSAAAFDTVEEAVCPLVLARS
jgi:hypothetical protein